MWDRFVKTQNAVSISRESALASEAGSDHKKLRADSGHHKQQQQPQAQAPAELLGP